MSETVRFESLRRRPPVGTQVDLGGLSPIQFEADKSGREFADVPADLAHILDRIPEGYRRVDASGTPIAAPKKGKPAAKPADAVQPASAAPADPDFVPVADDEAEDGVTEGDAAVELTDMDDEALRALFEQKVGRKASPRAARETLIAQIEQASGQ